MPETNGRVLSRTTQSDLLVPGLDLVTTDVDAEGERFTQAGANEVRRVVMGDFRWVTLADPDGNLFCVSADH